MRNYLRIMIAMALVLGIVVLVRNKVVWAGGRALQANQSALASLAGFVWNDGDRDGMQDVDEKGIRNVTVNLYDIDRTPVNTAITDETGRYQFVDLALGDYYVGFEVPAGFSASPKDQGKNEALDSDVDPTTHQTIPVTLVAGENTLKWDLGLYPSSSTAAKDPGTVKPPPGEITFCEDGVHSVGGVSTLTAKDLAPGYCIVAFLRNHAFAVGRIPDGAGEVLADITFVRVFYYGKLVPEVPVEDGKVQICYAMPPDVTAQIYFFDFYGPRFGRRTGQPSWEPLDTTIQDGSACAPAQLTGAYALIGQ